MFTGLIQSLGSIRLLGRDHLVLSVPNNGGSVILEDLAIGDSVAVDGICLTVEEILADGFVATASPETLQRTTLLQSSLAATRASPEGSRRVNLETSMRVGSKLGGHFVTGHVDGVACLMESYETEKAWEMRFVAPSNLREQWESNIAPYLVPKGSIAVNGISLTIADCDSDGSWFKAAVIPHTYKETNLYYLKSGNLVNIESDILGKYVAKLLTHRLGGNAPQNDISLSFLSKHGYL